MSDCGYITGNINKDLKPQNKFNVLKYFKISIDNKEKAQIVHQLMPKSVCESKFHKFFLYSDYLVVQSKLTNGIKHDEYLPYKFIDMFYDEDSIIIDGVVETNPTIFFFGKKKSKISFKFNTGKYLVNVVLFNRTFLKSKLTPGTILTLIGKFDKKHNTIVVNNLRFSKLSDKD